MTSINLWIMCYSDKESHTCHFKAYLYRQHINETESSFEEYVYSNLMKAFVVVVVWFHPQLFRKVCVSVCVDKCGELLQNWL